MKIRSEDENRGLGWLLLILLSLIWGTSFILIKKGLNVFNPVEVGSIRIATASLFLAPIAIRSLKKIDRRSLPYLLSVGFSGSLIPAYLFAKAQTQVDSSIAGVLNALTPLFVVIIGSLFFAQSITIRSAAGLLIGFAGTALLVMTGSSGIDGFNYFALFIVLATLCYGINLNLIKYKLIHMRALHITSISLFFVGPAVILYLLLLPDFSELIITSTAARWSLLYLTILGVMGTAVALIIFNKLVQITSPVFTASVTYLIPIIAVMWGYIDGESMLPGHFLGMVIILIGVYITNR